MPDTSLITDPEPKKIDNKSLKLADLSSSRTLTPNRDAHIQAYSVAPSVILDIDVDEYRKYTDEPLNPFTQDINAIRGEGQGSLEQARNFLGQFVIGEVLGGTIEIAGYLGELLDFESTLYGGQAGFTNAVVELGKGIKKSTQEALPIYEEKEGEVNMLDTGWWLKNGVSVASMLPLMGVSGMVNTGIRTLAKGISAGVKLSSVGKKTIKGIKSLDSYRDIKSTAGTFTQAFSSRYLESMMEASGVFQERYDEYIARGFTDEQAREYAAIGARQSFFTGYVMMLQDLPQYALLRRSFGVGSAGKEVANVAKKGRPSILETLSHMGSEGLEEAIQLVIAEEGAYKSDVAAGLVKPHEFGERLKEYIGAEMFTSALFGALGAGLAQGVSSYAGDSRLTKKIREKYEPHVQSGDLTSEQADELAKNEAKEIKEKEQSITPSYVAKDHSLGELYFDLLQSSDDRISKATMQDLVIHKAFKGTKIGKQEDIREEIASILSSTTEDLQSEFPDKQFKETDKELSQELLHAFDIASEQFEKNKRFGKFAEPIALASTRKILAEERASVYKSKIDETKASIPNIENLSKEGTKKLNAELNIAGAKKAISIFKDAEKRAKNSSEKRMYNSIIKDLNGIIKDQESIREDLSQVKEGEKELKSDSVILKDAKSFIPQIETDYANYIINGLERKNQIKKIIDNVEAFERSSKSTSTPKKSTSKKKIPNVEKGQLGQWTSMGVDQFPSPRKIVDIQEDGENKYVRFEGSKTYVAIEEVTPVESSNENLDKNQLARQIAEKKYKGETLSKDEDVFYEGNTNLVDNLVSQREDESFDLSGRRAKAGDRVKLNSNEDVVYNVEEIDGELVLTHPESPVSIPLDSAGKIEILKVVNTPEETEESEDSNPTEEDEYYNDEKDELQKSKTHYKQIWSGAWISTNNSRFSGEPTQQEIDTTNFFEDGAPIAPGTNGVARVDTDFAGEVDLNNLSTDEILELPIAVDLKDELGNQIYEGDTPIKLHVHTKSFLDKQFDKEIGSPEYIDSLATLTHRRNLIVQGLIAGEKVIIPIEGKGTGAVSYHGNAKSNVFELLGTEDLQLAILSKELDYRISNKVPKEFEGRLGKPSQKGRVYVATTAANGSIYTLPLERAKITPQEAEIVFELIKHYIGNRGIKNNLDGHIKKLVQDTPSLSQVLEMYPDMTFEDLFNFIIYESKFTEGKNREFRLDFKTKTLRLSSDKGAEIYNYDEINSNKDRIIEILTGHYRHIQRELLTDKEDGDNSYRDYLINNEILYASVKQGPMFVNPVVYFGTPYVERSTAGEIDEVSTPEIKNTEISEDVATQKLLNFGFSRSDISQMSKDEIDQIIREIEDKDETREDDEEAPFQRRVLAGSPSDNVLTIARELARKTGREFSTVDNPSLNWAGKVENEKPVFNLAYANENTAFHEYTHPIIRQIKIENPELYGKLVLEALLSDEGQIVYDAVKSTNPDYSNDSLVEETLVQLLGDLAEDRIKDNSLKGVLRRLWRHIVEFFTKGKNIDISQISPNTKIKDIVDMLVSKDNIILSDDPMFAYQKSNLTKREFDAWVTTLLNSVIRKNDVFSLSDVSNIDLSVIPKVIDSIFGQSKGFKKLKAARVHKEVTNEDGSLNYNSPIIRAITDKLRTFGIVQRREDESDTEDNENRSREDTTPYEINEKEKATSDIKFALSFIPKVNSSDTAENSERVKNSIYERDYKISDITGLPEYHTYSDIWNTILRATSNKIETKDESGKYTDIYDVFIKEIEKIAIHRPEFNIVIERIQNRASVDPSIKGKFVRSFYTASQNYLTSQTYFLKTNIIEKNPQSPEQQIIEQWTSNLLAHSLTTRKGKKTGRDLIAIDLDWYDAVKEQYSEWHKSVRQPNQYVKDVDPKLFTETLNMLHSLGIHFEPRELQYYLDTKADSPMSSLRILLTDVGHYMTSQGGLEEQKSIPVTDDTKWFTQTNKSVVELAKIKSFFNGDISDNNVLGADGKSAYNYSVYSMMSKKILDLKNDPDHLNSLMSHPFYKSSLFGKHLLGTKTLTLHNFSNIKTQFDRGNKPKSANQGDRLSASINMLLSGYLPLHARGSNTTEFVISGFDLIKSYSNSKGNVGISNTALDIFTDYFLDEFERIQHEQEYLDSNPERKIDLYHTAKEGELSPSQKIFIFPEMQNPNSEFYIPELFEDSQRAKSINRDAIKKNAVILDKIHNAISSIMEREVDNTIENLIQENIFDANGKNNIIDNEIFNKYLDETSIGKSNSRTRAIKALVYDYVSNGMIANKEQQKIFSGDPALYGDQINLQKRIISSGSMGYSYYLRNGEEEMYYSAVIQDVIKPSSQKEYLKKTGIKGFNAINVADAQAYVTQDLYFDFLKGYGKWKKEYDRIEELLKKPIISREEREELIYRIVNSDFSMQPMKTVHSELHLDNTPRFIYDKQTILPLFDHLVEGTDLENILFAMKNNEVDHLSAQSGTKLGAISPTSVVDKDGNILRGEDIKLNRFTQSKRYTFLQQDLPKKGFGPMLESSQAKANITVDLKEGSTYKQGRHQYTRDEIIQEIDDTHSALSNIGKEEFLKEITDDGTPNTFNRNKANSRIKKEMTKRTLDDVLIEALDKDYPPEAIIGHNIPIQNISASIINNSTVRVKHTNGFAAIQVSSLGFTNNYGEMSEEHKRGITWLQEERELSPPMIVDGKLIGGGILLPHHILIRHPDIIDNPESLRKVLKGIDFRIPNQSISNIGVSNVVGILPPEMGDSAVVYGENIEKAGTDNDGDKFQIMLYNLYQDDIDIIKYWDGEPTAEYLSKVYDDRIRYEPMNLTKSEFIKKYKDSSPLEFNGRLAIENHKLDLYTAILESEDGYNRMMKALEGDDIEIAIEKTIAKVKSKFPNFNPDERSNFNPLNPLYQLMTRDIFLNANSSVGSVANNTTDHSKSQKADLYITNSEGDPVDLKLGHTVDINGEPASILSYREDGSISRMLSLSMNAQVDAEKNPFAPKGNFNIYTIPSALTMERLGMNIQDITDIIGSPIVREYINAKRITNNSFTYSSKSSTEQAIDRYNRKYNGNLDIETFNEKTKYNPNPSNAYEQLKFYKMMESISSNVSASARASKYSVDGLGKNVFELIANENLFNSVSGIGNFHRKFIRNEVPTMEMTYKENSVNLFKETFGKRYIALTPAFEHLVSLFKDKQGIDITDANTIENIYKPLYSYLISKAIDVNIADIIGKENSVARELFLIKEERDSPFINLLTPVFKNSADLISFPNSLQFSEAEKNALYDDWNNLYNDPETKDFAIRLAKYSYIDSGFKYGIHSFYQFMPVSIMEEFKIKEFIEDTLNDAQDLFHFSDAFDEIIRHEFDNSSLVPKGRTKDFKKKGNSYILTSTKKKFENVPEYIYLFEKSTTFKTGADKLLRLVDSKTKEYQEISKLGMKISGHNLVEYNQDRDDNISYFNKEIKGSPEIKSIKTSSENTSSEIKTPEGTTSQNSPEQDLINSYENILPSASIKVKTKAISNYFKTTNRENDLNKVLKSENKTLEEFINDRPILNGFQLLSEINKLSC